MRGAHRTAVLAGLGIFLGFAGTANAELVSAPTPIAEAAKPVAEAAAPVTQAVAPVTTSATPAQPAKPPAEPAAPVVKQATEAATRVVDSAARPAVDAAAKTTAPAVKQTTETTKPVVDAATQSTAPVIKRATETAKPVVDAATQSTAPVIKRATETTAPAVDRATQTISPAPVTRLSVPVTKHTISVVFAQPTATHGTGASGTTPRKDADRSSSGSASVAQAAAPSAPMTTVPPAELPAGGVAGMTESSPRHVSVPVVREPRMEVSGGDVPRLTIAASGGPVVATVIPAAQTTSQEPAAPRVAISAPATSPPAASSVPGGGMQSGTGMAFMLLALLAGLAALLRPTASWRIHLAPASWRPAPYLALLERPG